MNELRRSRAPLTVLADGVEQAGYMFVLLGQAAARLGPGPNPARAWGRFKEQLYTQIVKSLLVVVIVGVFIGMVLALQTGEELKRYGGESFLGSVVAGALCREMGPFITSIILAATAGGAIAAELGTMRVSEEIDALELMNIDPVAFLVTPRIVALTFACVLLTVLVDAVGILGGALVAHSHYDIRYSEYFEVARQAMGKETIAWILPKDIFSGIAKAWVFGLLIGALSCGSGLTASGGALGVGKAVRTAVVASIVVVLIVGYVLTWFFWT